MLHKQCQQLSVASAHVPRHITDANTRNCVCELLGCTQQWSYCWFNDTQQPHACGVSRHVGSHLMGMCTFGFTAGIIKNMQSQRLQIVNIKHLLNKFTLQDCLKTTLKQLYYSTLFQYSQQTMFFFPIPESILTAMFVLELIFPNCYLTLSNTSK